MSKGALFCLLGASGSGKSVIADMLEEVYGLKVVRSYTTKPRRSSLDNTHTFVSEEEFNKLDLLEQAQYSGYSYGTTAELLDSCDIHVIEPKGFLALQESYGTHRMMFGIHIYADAKTREKRMFKRGDAISEIERRLEIDNAWFANVEHLTSCVINNNADANLLSVVQEVYTYINRWNTICQGESNAEVQLG